MTASNHPRSRAQTLLAHFALIGLIFGVVGCDRSARRAERATPLPRLQVAVAKGVPFRIYTSRRGPMAPGRPHSVLIELEAKIGLLSYSTEVVGVHGVAIVGGKRLNHGSASRKRVISRAVTAETQPGSAGTLLVDVAWMQAIDTPESRSQVAIPLPAKSALPK
ncbi:MAG: hypothetical protein KC502_22225 [Myxococcales bacterium]|nr:hypothetical protein [Myxococcales bacterium]